MKRISVIAAVAVAAAWTPFAVAITIDGDLADWGVTIPAAANAPGSWAPTIGQYIDDDGQVGPGGGGQNYDIEAMYTHISGNILHFAMVTGFEQGGEVGDFVFLPHYDGGDIFFNFGGVSGYNVAVRITESVRLGSTGIGNIYVGDFSPSGNSYLNTEDVFVTMYGAQANPWRVDDAAVGGFGVTLAGTTPIAYVDGAAPGDHNVFEFALNLANLGFDPALVASQGFSVHWTMECGNDIVDWSVPGRIVEVPEPATMSLLGLGLLGILLRRRRS